jgi:hypothetical protein
MLVPFENLPHNSRIWIFPSPKKLSETDEQQIETDLYQFVDSWESHGRKITGSFKIVKDHFIVIAADENDFTASGCSIDSSFRQVQQLERKLNASFTDRSFQAFEIGNNLQFFPLNKIKSLVESGVISEKTEVYDSSITSLDEFNTRFKRPALESWMKKYYGN